MKKYVPLLAGLLGFSLSALADKPLTIVDSDGQNLVLQAGDPSLKKWVLPDPPQPADNQATPERLELGKKLFFDTRLSGDGKLACVSCHDPAKGWADNQAKSIAINGVTMPRASLSLVNIAYVQPNIMWDGRKTTPEDLGMGPVSNKEIMGRNLDDLYQVLGNNSEYKALFEKAYPGQPINGATTAKALGVFQRSIISNNTPFDRWVKGDKTAMTPDQIKGFAIFASSNKANCAACHSAPTFSDNGFHNIGLVSANKEGGDVGRFKIRQIAALKGAFRTPALREVKYSAPYFHDGSAATLKDVVAHYAKGGEVKTNISQNVKPFELTSEEEKQLLAFMDAIATPQTPYTPPAVPK